jgi:hypothetical protein
MTVEGKFNSAGANLLKALITQVEKLPKPWQQLSQSEQERVIFHLREGVESSVRMIVKTIAAGDFMNIPAAVESVTFKGGVKAVVKLAKGTDGAHSLADCEGRQVLIVIASPDEYIDGIELVKAKADQSELFEQHDADIDTPQTNVSGDPSLDKPSPDSGVPQFLVGLLESVGCNVPLETVQGWTKEEITVAADWAGTYAKTPPGEMCAIARPHWLPIPEMTAAPSDETIVLSSDEEILGAIVLTGEELAMAVEDEGGDETTFTDDDDDDLDDVEDDDSEDHNDDEELEEEEEEDEEARL